MEKEYRKDLIIGMKETGLMEINKDLVLKF